MVNATRGWTGRFDALVAPVGYPGQDPVEVLEECRRRVAATRDLQLPVGPGRFKAVYEWALREFECPPQELEAFAPEELLALAGD